MKKDYKLGFSLIEISVVILIIGILIAAITTGADLVKKSKIASAQNLTSNTPIYAMKDLVLWFEPSLETSFDDPAEGETLSSWNNASPYYNIGSATQSTDSNRPLYKKDATNHIPAVRFNAADQYFEINDLDSAFEERDLTIFILENRDDDDASTRRLITSDEGTDGLNIFYNTSNFFTVMNNNTTSQNVSFTTQTSEIPALHFITLFDNAGNGDFEINSDVIVREGFYYYHNKRLPENSNMPAADQNLDSTSPYRLNNDSVTNLRLGDDDESYKGDLSEVIIFNRKLRKRELVDIFNYFEAKYNISLAST